ncbi:MAG: HPF/RaiA family ribosome-associated protein [Chloroflexi bacterium]|nr:HPF/RaiA family ribosome-associated protein [Chloroflexota bacterium]
MPQNVDVQTRNMEMTERINDYVSKKSEKLVRHLQQIEEVRVELTYNKSARSEADRYTSEITVRGKKMTLRT